MVARSQWLINEIHNHDWLRRRGGSINVGAALSTLKMLKQYPFEKGLFKDTMSPDVTINSRILLADLLNTFQKMGGVIVNNCNVNKILDRLSHVEVETDLGIFKSANVVICAADGVSKFTNASIKISYAPMFVVDGLPDNFKSFVELDYKIKTCINLLNKGNGIGLAGGISLSRKNQISEYMKYCIDLHKKRNPQIKILDSYVGLKKELVNQQQARNYLYHINGVSQNVWSVVLGKFTLMFSLAPEFIRRVYKVNPTRMIVEAPEYSQHNLLSNAKWYDIANNGRV
jgi:hypothetical protein